jgi:hypothetical protein
VTLLVFPRADAFGSSAPGQSPVEKIQAILSPEDLAVHDVAGGAKHAGVDRLLSVDLIALVHGLRTRLLEARRRELALLQQLRQRGVVGDVAVFDPNRAQQRIGDVHRGMRAVLPIDGDDQACCVVGVNREELGLQVDRRMQPLGEAPEFEQPVRLALRCALGQRQAA